jgi:hypothetical protein
MVFLNNKNFVFKLCPIDYTPKYNIYDYIYNYICSHLGHLQVHDS